MAESLLDRLGASRQAFLDALEAVDADLVTVPGVMEDWSVRDIVVHVAAWCDHGKSALELAVAGQGDAFDYSTSDTDAMNARILADGRAVSPTDALAREDAAFTGFRERVDMLDPALRSLRLGNGHTVDEVVRYDGPDHYAEHTDHLRAWFGTDDDEQDEVTDAP